MSNLEARVAVLETTTKYQTELLEKIDKKSDDIQGDVTEIKLIQASNSGEKKGKKDFLKVLLGGSVGGGGVFGLLKLIGFIGK